MDLTQQPTVAPTGDPALVNPTLAGNLVNPAQASVTSQAQAQYVPPTSQPAVLQQSPDVSGLIANYENRLRALMSEKDKAVNERNASITSQAQMQAQLTQLQESATTGLSQAVDNAQRAINENTQLRAQVQALQGELVRFKVLAETPDLLPYASFIPANADEAVVRQHADTFRNMRQADLDRFRPTGQQGYGSYTPSTFPGIPPIPQFTPAAAVAPVPGGQQAAAPVAGQQAQAQAQAQAQQGQPNVMNLYQNRPTMAPQYQGQPLVPGSQPAMMSPAGAQSTPDSINAMLRAAMDQGPDAFNAALEQAKTLATSYTNQQLGR